MMCWLHGNYTSSGRLVLPYGLFFIVDVLELGCFICERCVQICFSQRYHSGLQRRKQLYVYLCDGGRLFQLKLQILYGTVDGASISWLGFRCV